MTKDLIISWNNFTGWITDKLEWWPEWSYYQAYNVQTRDFYATSTWTHNTLWTYEWYIRWIYEAWKHSNSWGLSSIVWLDNWKIYLNWSLVNQISTTTQRQWEYISYLDDNWVVYLYMFPWGWNSIVKYIHKITTWWVISQENYSSYVIGWWTYIWAYSWTTTYAKWNVVSDSWSFYKAITTTTWNLPSNTTYWLNIDTQSQVKSTQVVYSDSNIILFSYNNCLYQFDWITTTDVYQFPKWENIIWITTANWNFRIYTNYNDADSYVYTMTYENLLAWELWDIISFTWYAINSVVDSWSYDYLTANWWLYIYPVSNIEDWEILHWINLTALIRKWPLVYLNYINKSSNYNLATYWKKPWFNSSLEATKWLSWLVNSNATIDYNSNYIIYAIWTTLYSNSFWTGVPINSYIESLNLKWDNIRIRKQIDYIEIKFKWATNNCKIKVDAQIDDSWTWQTIWEWINVDSTTNNYWVKLSNTNLINPIWEFNMIRFRVYFESDWVNTFKFYWIDLKLKEWLWV